jgi:hypothetical protein
MVLIIRTGCEFSLRGVRRGGRVTSEDAWPSLPEPIKAAVLTLVQTATKGGRR